MRRALVTAAAFLVLLAGCGEKADTERTPKGRGSAAGGFVDERAATAPEARTFEDEYERALALDEGARFSAALALLGRMEKESAGHPEAGKLDEAKARVRHERRAALELPSAVKELGSESAEVATAAGKVLVRAGRAGRIFLHKAVLEENARIAVEAAKILVELGEGRGPGAFTGHEPPGLSAREVFKRRLESNPPEALRSILAHGLVKLAEGEDPDRAMREFYELVVEDRRFVYREVAAALCRAFAGRLEKDRGKLARVVGVAAGAEEGAYARLRLYVERALGSGDDVLAAWAVDCAPAMDLMVRGLRGSYYHGRNFEKLVHEQLDARIDVPDRRFPYPDGRQDDISVRWTGLVRIERGGRYTLYSASDDGQRLWVDGKQLVNDWTMHGVEERSGQVRLEPGLHPFKVEFMQGVGGASIRVSWSGPGIEKQVIPGDAFLTVPWKGMR